MGIILKVRDQEMRRTLAMKRMRADRSADDLQLRRFVQSNHVTGTVPFHLKIQ